MPSSGSAMVMLATDDQIVITREFNAPRHLVYRAFTTPELVRRWWHAKRGTMTVASEAAGALVVLCLGDLMIVLDVTIVGVALPSIREDLGFSESSLACSPTS